MMDRLAALKVFCTVMETGGFSKAADRLGMSTSSVTNQVAALESHFKIKLLNRTTRRVSATDEGRQCYQQALGLLSDMEDLENVLQSAHQTPSGTLRIDMPGSISRQIIAPALPVFFAAYPELRLRLTVSDQLIDMVEEGIDVLIRIGDLPSSNLIAKTLCKTRYMCYASPSFISQYGMPASPEDLGNFHCLNFVYPKSRQLRPWHFQRGSEGFSFLPPASASMDHVESLITAAIAGGGVIQVLSISVIEQIRSGTLVPLLQKWEAPGPDVSILFQQKHHRAAKVKAFVDFAGALFAATRAKRMP